MWQFSGFVKMIYRLQKVAWSWNMQISYIPLKHLLYTFVPSKLLIYFLDQRLSVFVPSCTTSPGPPIGSDWQYQCQFMIGRPDAMQPTRNLIADGRIFLSMCKVPVRPPLEKLSLFLLVTLHWLSHWQVVGMGGSTCITGFYLKTTSGTTITN